MTEFAFPYRFLRVAQSKSIRRHTVLLDNTLQMLVCNRKLNSNSLYNISQKFQALKKHDIQIDQGQNLLFLRFLRLAQAKSIHHHAVLLDSTLQCWFATEN